jgi:two-component system, NarL family, sensor kinase
MPFGLRTIRKDSVRNTSEIRSALTRFLLVGVASLVLVAVPTVLLFNSIALNHGLETAIESGRNLTVRTLAPDTTTATIAGDPTALARINLIVGARMGDGSITRIKIWTVTGRVVYCDEAALIGRTFPLPEVATLLRAGSRSGIAEMSQKRKAENEFETDITELVEVYTLGAASTGEPLIYEAYFPASLVNTARHDLLIQMAPVGLAALVLLSLVQLPSAMHLSRRVQVSRQSRERLLVQTVAAADHERRRLAQELHDEVIQDLAGVAYALSSLGDHLDAKNGPAVEGLGKILRRDVGILRAMVTELIPPELDPQNMASSLSDLGAALREAGARVDVDVDDDLGLNDTTATLIYRVARESMHNAAKHGQPSKVDVRIARGDTHTVLTVVDDGRGFESTVEPAPGHFGLKLIRDTVAEAGGTLLVDSRIGQGTRVELSLPHS